MAGRGQLQRALLDAAAILSSAANIARRAAVSIDSDTLQRASPVRKAAGETDKTAGNPARQWPSKAYPAASLSRFPSAAGSTSHPVASADEVPLTDDTSRNDDDPCSMHERSKPTSTPIEELSAEQPSAVTTSKAEVASDRSPKSTSETPPSKADEELSTVHLETPAHHLGRSTIHDFPDPSTSLRHPDPQHIEAEEYDATTANSATPLRAAKVPSSRIARLLHYGSLGAGLAWGAAGSYLRGEPVGGEGKQFMSDDNVRRLVDKLSTMRGAALKLGQFMSIQDSNLLPEQIEQVMLRVQNSAAYMPQWQMEKVMRQDFGPDWRQSFDSFDDVPFASASIGQVHAATLSARSTSPLAGQKVAVKVQFPGVRESIGSDLSNLRWLVTASALLPRGLFLDNTIRVMRRELDDECDYEREKAMCSRFGQLLNGKSNFSVPRVVDEMCSPRVLTCEMMKGRPLTQAGRFPQEQRNSIARAILELSLKELFTFRLMQTDPNWTNFLFNERTGKIELIDFGATREYSKTFMDDWLCMLRAAISGDREACIHWSEKVGYLTGEEKDSMRNAHLESMIALGEPFRPDAPDPYPFAHQTITNRVRAQIPLMLRERLTPPPEPTYSLNRKLSGAFLLCARLKANVSCRGLLDSVTKDYVLGQATVDPRATKLTTSSGGAHRRGLHTSRAVESDKYRSNTGRPSRSHDKRQRLGNLADRWPRHIVKAIKDNVAKSRENETGPDDFLTLSAEPRGTSLARPASDPDGSTVNLHAQPTGGQNVRPSDAAESPTTALDDAQNKSSLGDKPVFVRGIAVPRKPNPPGPEDCCMSGCARCVYDLYAEDLQDYQKDLTAARDKIMALDPPMDAMQWPQDLLGPRPSDARENDPSLEARSAEERAQDEVEAVIGRLDPSMKAFLQLERSLKRKGKHPTSGEQSQR